MGTALTHRHTASGTSVLIRLLGALSYYAPDLLPSLAGLGGVYLSGILLPVIYALSLPSWLRAVRRGADARGEVVEEREIVQVVAGKGTAKKRAVEKANGVQMAKVKKTKYVRREGEKELHRESEQGRDEFLFPSLSGLPGSSRLLNAVNLVLNGLIVLGAMDQAWSPLFLSHSDVQYARVSAISPHAARINLRLPATSAGDTEIIYRPTFSAAAGPLPWEHSGVVSLRGESDHFGQVDLDGLSSGVLYQYRVKQRDGSFWPSPKDLPFNFTTAPDPRLAQQSHFKFLHAGRSRNLPHPYTPLGPLAPLILPWLPSTDPHVSPTPTHLVHSWKAYHTRQPAYRALADWLADMRDRVAWAQVQFAFLGEEMELAGQRRRALGVGKDSESRQSRAFMASRDVRDVYETIPILPSRVHSPSEGAVLEPAALSSPESSFAYADNHFYRLRKPALERSARDSQDWLADVGELEQWLVAVNATTGFKFVLSPLPLNPFFGGDEYESQWRTAVLDLLRHVPNVIVLSETNNDLTMNLLRNRVIEISSPPLDTPHRTFLRGGASPDRSRATEEPISSWVREHGKTLEEISLIPVDRVLRHVPTSGGAQWTSIEVDETEVTPRAYVVAYQNGKEVARLQVVGRPPRGATALGGVAESFTQLLRRFGLLSAKWF